MPVRIHGQHKIPYGQGEEVHQHPENVDVLAGGENDEDRGETLTKAEAERFMVRWARMHPTAVRMLCRVMAYQDGRQHGEWNPFGVPGRDGGPDQIEGEAYGGGKGNCSDQL